MAVESEQTLENRLACLLENSKVSQWEHVWKAPQLAMCLEHVWVQWMALRLARCSVFAWDYAGYGASTGTPREANLYRGIEAAWCTLRQRFGVPAKRIVLYVAPCLSVVAA